MQMRRFIEWALRLPFRLLPKNAVLPVLSGKLRGNRSIVGAATHGCWTGSYERLAQSVFGERIRPGSVVYDIGANAVVFTLLASTCGQALSAACMHSSLCPGISTTSESM